MAQILDWFLAAGNLAVGLLLGAAIGEWIGMEEDAFWFTVIYVFIPFGFVFLLVYFLNKVAYRGFFKGEEPAAVRRLNRRNRLAYLAWIAIGMVLGVIGSQFGFGKAVLDML